MRDQRAVRLEQPCRRTALGFDAAGPDIADVGFVGRVARWRSSSCQRPRADGEQALRAHLRKTTTRAKVMTCAMLPLIQSVRKAVTTPTTQAAITVPLSCPTPPTTTTRNAGMMYDVPSVGFVPEMRAMATPPTPARPGAEEEGDAVDVAGRDAQRLGELAVLHRRPDLATERAVLQHGVERRQRADRQHDREELAVRPVVAEHRDAAARASSARCTGSPWAPKMSWASCCSTSDTPTVTSSVSSGRWYIHWMTRDLQQQPEQAGDDEGHREGDDDREPGAGDHLLGDVRGVRADHEELAVRHVDHAHLPEREREAERGQQQDGARCGAGEEWGGEDVHASAFRSSSKYGSVQPAGPGVPCSRTAPPTTDRVGRESWLSRRSGPTSCSPRGTDRARSAPPSSTRCRTGCRR